MESFELLGSLLSAEHRCISVCKRLKLLYPDKRNVFYAMERQCREHLQCLSGISYLVKGVRPEAYSLSANHRTPEALARCGYLQCRNALEIYEQLSDHPEYGPVYALMAQKKQAQCQTFLSLFGKKI